MKKIFFVSTENGCNNNCLGCADNNLNKPKNGRDISGIFRDLELGAEKGYKNLHLAGGEVTIQDNIFQILKKAKELYDEVYITSNGRMFSYPSFTKKMVDAGITHFNITLCGPNKDIHESWTRTPGSFRQTIQGIGNLRSFTKKVGINYLVWKKSFDKVKETMELLEKMAIRDIDLFNLVPLGRARRNYYKLFVPLEKLLVLEDQLSLFKSFLNIEIEDFPLCIFSQDFMDRGDVHIFDTSGKIYKDKEGNIENYSLFAAREFNFCVNSNLTFQRQSESAENKFKRYRIKIKSCEGCPRIRLCEGIFCDYIKLVGASQIEKEINSLRQKRSLR